MGAAFDQAGQGAEADPGEGLHRAIVFAGEGGGMIDAQLRQALAEAVGIRQRHLHPVDARVIGHQRMQVIEVVGEQQAGEGHVGEWRLGGPVAHQAGQAGAGEIALAAGRQHQLGAAQDHRHMFAVAATQRLQVGAVTQVAADQLDRRARLMGPGPDLLRRRPLGETLAAAQQAQAVARIVEKHQVEGAEQPGLQVAGQADQAAVQREAVGDVAIQYELAVGAALVGQAQLVEPGGGFAFTAHGRALTGFRTAGCCRPYCDWPAPRGWPPGPAG
ncbi:hypothetical protein D3C84_474000 [compost metagenome]